MAASMPTAGTVTSLLADPTTRAQTIDALEAHGPHDETLTLAAVAAMSELMALDAPEPSYAVVYETEDLAQAELRRLLAAASRTSVNSDGIPAVCVNYLD